MLSGLILKTNHLFVISGPSGVGKTSLVKHLLAQKDVYLTTSCTTRQPRPFERNGREYWFLQEDAFKEKVANNAFLEHACVHGNYYGTLRSEIEDKPSGSALLVEIDYQGAWQIKRNSPSGRATLIFIVPPSWNELEARLRGRQSETEADILKRLNNARSELKQAQDYDIVICNETFEQTASDLSTLITAKMIEVNKEYILYRTGFGQSHSN